MSQTLQALAEFTAARLIGDGSIEISKVASLALTGPGDLVFVRVKDFPRLASRAAFLCLMVAHFECPDIVEPLARMRAYGKHQDITRRFKAAQLLGCCC